MRPQTAHPLNNLTKAAVRKPLSPSEDCFGQMSPDFQRRIKHQGKCVNCFEHGFDKSNRKKLQPVKNYSL